MDIPWKTGFGDTRYSARVGLLSFRITRQDHGVWFCKVAGNWQLEADEEDVDVAEAETLEEAKAKCYEMAKFKIEWLREAVQAWDAFIGAK